MDGTREGFYQEVDALWAAYMAEEPSYATQLGVHRYDNRLADLSWDRQDATLRRMEGFLAGLDRYAPGEDGEWAVDVALMRAIVGRMVRNGRTLDLGHRSPDAYVAEALYGPYLLLMTEFAPLPERLAHLAGRLRDVPGVVDAAYANLRDVPGVWIRIAQQSLEGGMGLFGGLVPALADGLAPTHRLLAAEVRDAADGALKALERFAHFLEVHVQAAPDDAYAVGTRIWNEKAREEQMLDLDADAIEAIGHELVASTQRELEAEARRLDPDGGKSWRELLSEVRAQHPTRAGLLDAYREAMAASRQFVIDHDLVTLPPDEQLIIQETPPPVRPTYPFAGYVQPGPFEAQQHGVFWVTPVDEGLDEAAQEIRLRGHPWAKIPIMAVHEGYPGHHVQLVWANRARTLPRRLSSELSTLLIEGWAFYCEEMMEEQGFLTDPRGRLMRLAEQLWRACRIVIDVGLHCRGMGFAAAVEMLVTVAGLERPDAVAEVQRYSGSPTQPMSYLIGKREIGTLAAAYRQQAGAGFRLKQFHDDLLACGSLPPRLLRQQLLGREG